MEQNQQKPTLTIECPDGTIIRIFQKLSNEYINELVEVFTKKEGVMVNNDGSKMNLITI